MVFQAGQALSGTSWRSAIIAGADGSSICLKRILQDRVGTMDGKDFRALDTKFDAQGMNCVQDVRDQHARSSLSVLKSMVAGGLTPIADHERWVRTSELPREDRSVDEMEVITRVLEALIMIDQVNVPCLTGCKLLLRRWHLIREAHHISPGAPDYSSADVVMGVPSWRWHQPGPRKVCRQRVEGPGSGAEGSEESEGGSRALKEGWPQIPRPCKNPSNQLMEASNLLTVAVHGILKQQICNFEQSSWKSFATPPNRLQLCPFANSASGKASIGHNSVNKLRMVAA